MDLDSVPEHMREDAECYGHFLPKFYEEDECHCGKLIYRYQMDVVVEWKHFNHATYCDTRTAKPVGR